MARAGVAGRLAKVEARVVEAGYRHLARQAAAEHGLPLSEVYAELRRAALEIVAHCGPRPDTRAVATWMAERDGEDPEAVYAELLQKRARRKR